MKIYTIQKFCLPSFFDTVFSKANIVFAHIHREREMLSEKEIAVASYLIKEMNICCAIFLLCSFSLCLVKSLDFTLVAPFYFPLLPLVCMRMCAVSSMPWLVVRQGPFSWYSIASFVHSPYSFNFMVARQVQKSHHIHTPLLRSPRARPCSLCARLIILKLYCAFCVSWLRRLCVSALSLSSTLAHPMHTTFGFLLFPFIFKLNFNVWLCMYLFVEITFLMKLFNIL